MGKRFLFKIFIEHFKTILFLWCTQCKLSFIFLSTVKVKILRITLTFKKFNFYYIKNSIKRLQLKMVTYKTAIPNRDVSLQQNQFIPLIRIKFTNYKHFCQ